MSGTLSPRERRPGSRIFLGGSEPEVLLLCSLAPEAGMYNIGDDTVRIHGSFTDMVMVFISAQMYKMT